MTLFFFLFFNEVERQQSLSWAARRASQCCSPVKCLPPSSCVDLTECAGVDSRSILFVATSQQSVPYQALLTCCLRDCRDKQAPSNPKQHTVLPSKKTPVVYNNNTLFNHLLDSVARS